MKPGNLVKITCARIGIPAGTLGLIIKSYLPCREDPLPIEQELIYTIKLIGLDRGNRRYLARDLEIVS